MLRLFSYLWGGITAARARAYGSGLLPVQHLSRPALSVGALEMGGTGKSPAVTALVQLLLDLGLEPAILSRGYGRQGRDPVLVSSGSGLRVGVREAGDEPAGHAHRFPRVTVAVAAKRERAAALVERFNPDVFVLDDAFQHLRVARGTDLLVVDPAAPFWESWPPPAGRLREWPAAAARAHAFLLMNDSRNCERHLAQHFPGRPCFRLAPEPATVSELGAWLRGDGPDLDPGTLPQPLVLFAGIARPHRFRDTVAAAGLRVAEQVWLRDHHWYGRADVDSIEARAQRAGAAALVTTEKDAIRLAPGWPGEMPVWVWNHRLRPQDPAALGKWIANRLAREAQPT